jgi:hypothetical protein
MQKMIDREQYLHCNHGKTFWNVNVTGKVRDDGIFGARPSKDFKSFNYLLTYSMEHSPSSEANWFCS